MPITTDKIYKLLKEQGITAKEVATATGIAQSSFTDWKKGRSNPSYGALVKLAEYFGVTVAYLEGTSEENPTLKPKYSNEALKIAAWWDRLDEISQAIIKGEILRRLEGKGTSLPVQHTASVPCKNTVAEPNTVCDNVVMLNLPFLGRSAAGTPIEMVSVPNDPITINGETRAKIGDFIVIAVGDSMIEAGIHDGDRCVIRPRENIENGVIYLVAVDDGSTL